MKTFSDGDGLFRIDKGVPTPVRLRSPKYPFAAMEVGDSFFAPLAKSGAVINSGRRHFPKQFTTRTVVEDGVRGVRVWRTK